MKSSKSRSCWPALLGALGPAEEDVAGGLHHPLGVLGGLSRCLGLLHPLPVSRVATPATSDPRSWRPPQHMYGTGVNRTGRWSGQRLRSPPLWTFARQQVPSVPLSATRPPVTPRASLRERAQLGPRSIVPTLDALLAAYRQAPAKIRSQLAPKIGHRGSGRRE
jgi:hypothetical protein